MDKKKALLKIREYRVSRKAFNRYSKALEKPEFSDYAVVSANLMMKERHKLDELERELCEMMHEFTGVDLIVAKNDMFKQPLKTLKYFEEDLKEV